MNKPKTGRIRTGAAALTAVFAVAACQDQETTNLLEPAPGAGEAVVANFDFSSFTASAGEEVAASLNMVAPEGTILAGVEGTISFDPRHVSYEGQLLSGSSLVVFNDDSADEGEIRFQALDVVDGLDGDVALMGFQVLSAGFDRSFRVEFDHVVDVDGAALPVTFADAGLDRQLPEASTARRLAYGDWTEILTGARAELTDLQRSPDDSNVYGDADLNNSVNVLDNLYVSNVSVGNFECITGTDSPGRDCIAGDVDPAGPPVGNDAINVLDNLRIALESTGNDQPAVGEPIPQQNRGDGTRVCFPGMGNLGAGTCQGGADVVYTSPVTLDASLTYVLPRVARFGDDGTQGTGSISEAQLIVPAGTRIEGTDSSAIVITRAGQLLAEGTPEQPVTFTCVDDGPSGREPGCWGGIYLAGNAVVNEDDGLAPGNAPNLSALSFTSATGGSGVNQRAAEGFLPADLFFGNNDDASSCGVLEYVVIEWGGRSVDANNELNNLTTGACGAGTVIDHVMTFRGTDDGFEFFGGRHDVSNIYAVGNDDDNIDYSFGFDGSIQYLIVHMLGGDKAFEVDNTEDPITYTATPRTESEIWNVTIVCGSEGAPNEVAYNYRRGALSSINNALVIECATVFDVDDSASCNGLPGSGAAAAGRLTFDSHLVLSQTTGTTLTSSNACGTALTNYISGQPASQFEARNYGGELRDPFSGPIPDYRPAGPISTSVVAATPPAGFGPGAFLGAVGETSSGSIPWYLGWARNWTP